MWCGLCGQEGSAGYNKLPNPTATSWRARWDQALRRLYSPLYVCARDAASHAGGEAFWIIVAALKRFVDNEGKVLLIVTAQPVATLKHTHAASQRLIVVHGRAR